MIQECKLLFGVVAIIGATYLPSPVAAASLNQGATVIDQFGCFLSSSASGLPVGLFTSDATHAVNTPSGNSLLQCHFIIPASALPAEAIVKTGFTCNTFLGLTSDSESVVTPGGHATLRCTVQ
jgi:hypothetical protein